VLPDEANYRDIFPKVKRSKKERGERSVVIAI